MKTSNAAQPTPFKRIYALTAFDAVPCYREGSSFNANVTPYAYQAEVYDVGGIEAFVTVSRDTEDEANKHAQLVATAVSSHADLMEALKFAQRTLSAAGDASGVSYNETLMAINAAIAKGENRA